MSELVDALKRAVNADGAITKCGECHTEFFNSFREPKAAPFEAAAITKTHLRDHEITTGHDDLVVKIVNPPKDTDEVDFTVVETDG